jgi:DNA-binding NarL/FixJ family response regulator
MSCPFFPNTVKVQFDRTKARAKVSMVRVLVVEDFAAFRLFISSTLATRQDLQIVGEASDGLEAVQKAVELNPDLVLMDIGLPSQNGVEAARQIRELVPEAKIIFLTQESSGDVVEEALSLGASSYVVKVNAGIDLLPAIEAIISGREFVSGRQRTSIP